MSGSSNKEMTFVGKSTLRLKGDLAHIFSISHYKHTVRSHFPHGPGPRSKATKRFMPDSRDAKMDLSLILMTRTKLPRDHPQYPAVGSAGMQVSQTCVKNLVFRKEWMRQTPELWLEATQQYCGAEFCDAEVRKGLVELGMGAHLGIPALFLAQSLDLQQLSHFMASFSAVCFD